MQENRPKECIRMQYRLPYVPIVTCDGRIRIYIKKWMDGCASDAYLAGSLFERIALCTCAHVSAYMHMYFENEYVLHVVYVLKIVGPSCDCAFFERAMPLTQSRTY